MRENVRAVGELDASALDSAFADWLVEQRRTGEDPNPGINAFGCAFGQLLVDAHGLEWVVATDEYGTEIAVHGDAGDLLVYPTNFVAKRWESGETGFIADAVEQIGARVRELRDG